MKDSVIIYRSFYEAIKACKPSDRARIYDAIMAYAMDDVEPELTGTSAAMFALMRPQIDANMKRWESGSKGGRPKKEKPLVYENAENEKPLVSEYAEKEKPMVSENGENTKPTVMENGKNEKPKHNQTETKTKPNHNQSITKPKPNENENENVNENENEKEKEKKKKKFTPPTLDEVKAYIAAEKLDVDGESFYAYFTDTGWIDSKGQKVNSWKGKLRTWSNFGKPKKEKKQAYMEGSLKNDLDLLEQIAINGRAT